eukprot:Nk52_evm3s710 gene=Nk52_evmTU3s710
MIGVEERYCANSHKGQKRNPHLVIGNRQVQWWPVVALLVLLLVLGVSLCYGDGMPEEEVGVGSVALEGAIQRGALRVSGGDAPGRKRGRRNEVRSLFGERKSALKEVGGDAGVAPEGEERPAVGVGAYVDGSKDANENDDGAKGDTASKHGAEETTDTAEEDEKKKEEEEVIAEKEQEEQHVADSVAVFVLMVLLILTIITVWIFKTKRLRFIHESGLSIMYGVVFGMVIRLLPGDRVQGEIVFQPELFFFLLLPPIIFHAGYSLNKKYFFRNFMGILLFALVGTLIAAVLTGVLVYLLVLTGFEDLASNVTFVDCMVFGSLISATDPVTVLAIFHDFRVDFDLNALIFGESVLNDAVAIVLYSTFMQIKHNESITFWEGALVFCSTFAGSFSLGVLIALITAIFLKYTTIREYSEMESALFVVMSYSSYIIAEGSGLSGIVSILFCGVVQAHYSFHNMSSSSQVRIREFFEALNFLAENFIFSYLGISLFTYEDHVFKPLFLLWSIIVILVTRACNVFPLSYLFNYSRRDAKDSQIPMKFQIMMWFSGLRGAIAFALSMQNTDNEAGRIILSTTLIIVLLTVLVMGGLAPSALDYLEIETNIQEGSESGGEDSSDERGDFHLVDSHNRGSRVSQSADDLELQASRRSSKFVEIWLDFDRRYLKPFFIVDRGMYEMDGDSDFPSTELSAGQFTRTSFVSDDGASDVNGGGDERSGIYSNFGDEEALLNSSRHLAL